VKTFDAKVAAWKSSEPTSKLVMNGPGYAGKTCFLARGFTGLFLWTVRFSMSVRSEKHDVDVQICLWDTFGRSDYARLRPLVYPDTDLMVLCFDIASRMQFELIFDEYLPEVHHHIPTATDVLLGLKADQRQMDVVIDPWSKEQMVLVERKEIEARASKFNLTYFEVSALKDPDGW
jgi:GTPase SAR1 family protein